MLRQQDTLPQKLHYVVQEYMTCWRMRTLKGIDEDILMGWDGSGWDVMLRAVLCCAVLCCAVLCCAVLCCAVLCCAVPCADFLSV